MQIRARMPSANKIAKATRNEFEFLFQMHRQMQLKIGEGAQRNITQMIEKSDSEITLHTTFLWLMYFVFPFH